MRQQTYCENQGDKKSFRNLLDQDIQPNEVLEWSSAIEMAELYATIYYNRSMIKDNDEQFLCQCTKLGTFGKFCEYQLTHNQIKFTDAIKAQFYEKEVGDSWNTQRYGNILCYQTLSCESSPLCLDWREICNGAQRCSNGIDEENCDKLEFNECEDDEFRCNNGMCIAEEFWFDGERDCMDWTDEYLINNGEHCPFTANTIECDEHLCPTQFYSCGDGECVRWEVRMAFRQYMPIENHCFSKRNLNYMCEVSYHKRAWTLENGMCWPDEDYNDHRYPAWNLINISNLTEQAKCQYLFRCLLSDNFEHDCPCRYLNCKQIMTDLCGEHDQLLHYPPIGLINANILIAYNYSKYERGKDPDHLLIGGSIKCQGYLSQATKLYSLGIHPGLIGNSLTNQMLCTVRNTDGVHQNFTSRFQYDRFCWNGSLTFNDRPYAGIFDLCTYSGQCISQYRIHDALPDCLFLQDEIIVLTKSSCTGNVARQRFQCYNDQHMCLTSIALGTGLSECSNSYDESAYGTGVPLRQDILCIANQTTGCHQLKDYIQQSSIQNSTRNHSFILYQTHNRTNRIGFRSYCDSWWDSNNHMDEEASSCQYWICSSDQYQCQTGQCINLNWVCDGEWDCTDASDEEGTVIIQQWSPHNARLPNLSDQLDKCRRKYFQRPFFNICNVSYEFGCLRSDVSDPLNIQLYRPCINLTQIGDGKEDCYNAYDEKNTFTIKATADGMWGFNFHCHDDEKDYLNVCRSHKTANCTDVLCAKYRDINGSCSDTTDFICLKDNQCKKNSRCDRKIDCPDGEDEYWCATGSLTNQVQYRFDKIPTIREQTLNITFITYPNVSIVTETEHKASKLIIHHQNNQFFYSYSYICNRGITVLHMNGTRCFCSPAYYGDRCQFFSDRVTVTAHLDRKALPKSIFNTTLKIQANFFFNGTIIDQHEFNAVPKLEATKIIKHKFYLLYSRSSSMLQHKQNRYFDRTDIIINHPYSVHFLLFALHQNNRPEELGTWVYPIYFDYLPAFRLAVVLKLPSWFEQSSSNHSQYNHCNEHSTFLPILNQNNSFYCSCHNGYYGINCEKYESICDTSCSTDAFCRPSKKSKPHCICPLGYFGRYCNLKYDQCNESSCENNGTCQSSYDPSGEQPFVCICSDRFYGNRCQYEKASVRVQLNMTTKFSARASVVQLYDVLFPFLTLRIKHQKVHEGFASIITYYHPDKYAPPLGILKVYAESPDPKYFIIYVLNQTLINITSSLRHCSQASLLLSQDTDRSVSIVFQYHRICQNNTGEFCFYDDNYLCLCKTNDFRAECFIHNPQLDYCDKCLSRGKCLQGDPTEPNDFLCLCPSCHLGHRCQFNLQAFGATFESLLIGYSTS
ncbi:unnamed protein product, partial [Adineta steineri]